MNTDLINRYIDCCIGSNGSHYDMSLVIYHILKDKYRYLGDNLWQYKNINDEWINDVKNNLHIINDIKSIVINYFLSRSTYWLEESKTSEDISLSNDNQIKSVRILQYSSKLKDEKFIKEIMKEIKQFFYYNIEKK